MSFAEMGKTVFGNISKGIGLGRENWEFRFGPGKFELTVKFSDEAVRDALV